MGYDGISFVSCQASCRIFIPFYTSGNMAAKENKIPVALDNESLAAIDRVAKVRNETRSAVMRAAIRAGLETVETGGGADMLRLDGNLSRFVDELAKEYGKTRAAILAEAVESGIRAVETRNLIEKTKADPEMENMGKAMEGWNDADIYPEKRVARQAMLERGRLQIQLDDIFRHCPDAKQRKELIEKHDKVMKKRYGSAPNMWGSGVSTEHLESNIKHMEEELAKGEGPSADAVAMQEQLERIENAPPRYAVKKLMKLPVQIVKPAKPGKPAKNKSSK